MASAFNLLRSCVAHAECVLAFQLEKEAWGKALETTRRRASHDARAALEGHPSCLPKGLLDRHWNPPPLTAAQVRRVDASATEFGGGESDEEEGGSKRRVSGGKPLKESIVVRNARMTVLAVSWAEGEFRKGNPEPSYPASIPTVTSFEEPPSSSSSLSFSAVLTAACL